VSDFETYKVDDSPDHTRKNSWLTFAFIQTCSEAPVSKPTRNWM